MAHEQEAFKHAVENAYAAMHRLRDVALFDDQWDRDLDKAVSDFVTSAFIVRNRYRELG